MFYVEKLGKLRDMFENILLHVPKSIKKIYNRLEVHKDFLFIDDINQSSSVFLYFFKGFFIKTDQGNVKDYIGRTHDGLYLCTACGKTEKFHSNLRAHVEHSHYSPGYACAKCGKSFSINRSCQKHQKSCNVLKDIPHGIFSDLK